MPITVFVADDHAIVRAGLVGVLAAQSDIRVVGTAADGRDTVRQVEKLKPEVVVMDIAMPQMNGIEAAREIHRRVPTARVVILSMHSSAEHVFHALEAGARAYLLKESAANEIVDAVRAAAQREAIPAAFAHCIIDVAALGDRVQDLGALAVAREAVG